MSRCTRTGALRGLKGCGRLGDDVEGLVGRQGSVALEDRGECFTGDELHDQERAAVFLAVVEHARDALVIDEGRVPGLGAEALEEAGVAHVLVFEDLDRDGTPDDVVGRFPDLAMPPIAIRDSSSYRPPKVTPVSVSCTQHRLHDLLRYRAAISLPLPLCPWPPPFSTTTATATRGSSAGAKPVNQRV